MGFLAGKRLLITGVLNNRSIAYGVARACHREGAELAFSHIERMGDRVVPLAAQLGSDITFEMDVSSDEDIARGFGQLGEVFTQEHNPPLGLFEHQQSQREGGFAGAAFAHHPQRLALAQGEANTIDGADFAGFAA